METITIAGKRDGKVFIEAGSETGAKYSFVFEDNAELEANIKRKLKMLHNTGIKDTDTVSPTKPYGDIETTPDLLAVLGKTSEELKP